MAMKSKAITNKFTLKSLNRQVAFQSSDGEKCKAMTHICSKILNYPCDIQPYTQIIVDKGTNLAFTHKGHLTIQT